jgi:hypothetical protein
MKKYEIVEQETGFKFIKAITNDNLVWFIPFDEANTDYQEYLASLEATEPEAE